MIPARLNPFRTERVERLPFRFADGWHWERLFAELKSRGFRAAIVGPHGSGKTTLLEQLGERLVGNAGRDLCGSQEHRSAEHCSARQSQQTRGAMLRAPLAQSTLAGISNKVAHFRLSEESGHLDRQRLLAHVASLPAETILLLDGAEQLGWWSWRRLLLRASRLKGLITTQHSAGRLPTLYHTSTSITLLGELGQALLEDAPSSLPTPDWAGLFNQFEGNVRDALRHCYAGAAVSPDACGTRPSTVK